jgi:hypothetical protein
MVDDQRSSGGVAGKHGEVDPLFENGYAGRQGVASFAEAWIFFLAHIDNSYYLFTVMKIERGIPVNV